jgi:hypothetical protein
MARRGWHWGSWLAVLLAAPLVQAQDKPKEGVKPAPPKVQQPPPDAEFLEFLGNWDSEDEEWSEFLAKAKAASQDVKKVEGQ